MIRKISIFSFGALQKGKFIVIEGLDRSGKSTVTKHLQQLFEPSKILLQNFPHRTTPIGKIINDFLKQKIQIKDQALHLLFSANRWEMIEALKMHINEGNHVICDRYWYSGVAYSTAKGLNYDWCLKPDIGLLEPDLVIFLKGDPEKLSSYSGFGQETYETVKFQKKVLEAFERIIKQNPKIEVIQIDDKKIQEIKKEATLLVQNKFKELF